MGDYYKRRLDDEKDVFIMYKLETGEFKFKSWMSRKYSSAITSITSGKYFTSRRYFSRQIY